MLEVLAECLVYCSADQRNYIAQVHLRRASVFHDANQVISGSIWLESSSSTPCRSRLLVDDVGIKLMLMLRLMLMLVPILMLMLMLVLRLRLMLVLKTRLVG